MRRSVLLLLTLLLALTGASAARAASPFAGHRIYTDCEFGHTGSAAPFSPWYHYYLARGREKTLLAKLAHVPSTKWFAGVDDTHKLTRQMERYMVNVDHPQTGGAQCSKHISYTAAQWRQGPVPVGSGRDAFSGDYPVFALRAMKHTRCHGWDGGPWNRLGTHSLYATWIRSFVKGLGRTWASPHSYTYLSKGPPSYARFRHYAARRAAVVLEPDALGLIGPYPKCLTKTAKSHVTKLLRYAVQQLRTLPHVATYLDVGASDWMTVKAAVKLLRASGIAGARGFALNATHFSPTRTEIRFGNKVAKILHTHFIVNTAENGRGTLPKSQWGRYGATAANCNPKNSGLGSLPTSKTGSPYADALLWVSRPALSSNSGNRCGRGPTQNVWWQARALQLARKAVFATAPWPSKPL